MSFDRPHHPDSVGTSHEPVAIEEADLPEKLAGKSAVPKLGLSTMDMSRLPPTSASTEGNIQSTLFNTAEEAVRRIWAPKDEAGPPSGNSDSTTDLATELNSEDLSNAGEANRIAARVAAAVELEVARDPKNDVVLACDKFDVLLVKDDCMSRLVTLDVTRLTNHTIQERVRLAAGQEMNVEPSSVQIFNAKNTLLESNSELYNTLADSSLLPLKAIPIRSQPLAHDVANTDVSTVSDILLASGQPCDCELGTEGPVYFSNQSNLDRLIALEQRLEATVSQIIGELAQEKRVRQSVCETLTDRVDSIFNVVETALGERRTVSPACASDRTGRPSALSDDAQDPNCSSLTEPPSACERQLDPRCEALLSASWRDFEIAEGALQNLSDDKADHHDHWRKILNVEKGVMTLGNELARRLCKVEHDSDTHRRHVVELEGARIADSIRLHSLYEAQSAELQSQCASLKVQAECLSSAIDGILQWVKDGEPAGFVTMIENLASLGGKLEDESVAPYPSRDQLLAVKDAVQQRRAASHSGVVAKPVTDTTATVSRSEVVPAENLVTPLVQQRVVLTASSPVVGADSGKIAMKSIVTSCGRSSSLEVPTSSNSSLRIAQGQMRSSSPCHIPRLSTVSRDASASRERMSVTPPRPQSRPVSLEYRSPIRSRSPTSYYRQNTYVTSSVNPLSSQSHVSANTTSLQSAISHSSQLAFMPVQPLAPPSPTLSSAPSIGSTLGNVAISSSGSFGWQENSLGPSRSTMPNLSATQASQSLNGSLHVTSSQAADSGARSLSPKRSPKRTGRSMGSPKAVAPQERVSVARPFRRLVSNSIGISSEP